MLDPRITHVRVAQTQGLKLSQSLHISEPGIGYLGAIKSQRMECGQPLAGA